MSQMIEYLNKITQLEMGTYTKLYNCDIVSGGYKDISVLLRVQELSPVCTYPIMQLIKSIHEVLQNLYL